MSVLRSCMNTVEFEPLHQTFCLLILLVYVCILTVLFCRVICNVLTHLEIGQLLLSRRSSVGEAGDIVTNSSVRPRVYACLVRRVTL